MSLFKNPVSGIAAAVFGAALFLSSCTALQRHGHHDYHDYHGHAHHHDHHDEARLLVYLDSGTVMVVDAFSGEILKEFAGILDPGAASVGVSSTGEFGFVIHRDSWVTAVIDSGFHLEEHGDHYDLHVKDPALLEVITTGAKPAHFTSALGKSVIFNDDDGTAAVFDEKNLRSSRAFQTVTARTGHGAPVITGDALVAGYVNHPEVDVISYDGTFKQNLPSGTRVHGAARLGRHIVFGAMEGIVLLEREGREYTSYIIPYPGGFPEEGRIGHFRSHILVPHFAGRVESSLAKIDHIEKTIRLFEMPAPFRHFDFDSTGRYLAVLGQDGILYSIDPHTFEAAGSIKAAEISENMPDPLLAAGKRHVWVSDASSGKIVLIDLEDMKKEAEIAIPGPGRIAGLGLMQTEGVKH